MSGNDWVYGLHAVESLLKHNPDSILQLYVLQGRADDRLGTLLNRAANRGIPVSQLSRAELDEKTGGVHQGIAALCRELKLEKSELLPPTCSDVPASGRVEGCCEIKLMTG